MWSRWLHSATLILSALRVPGLHIHRFNQPQINSIWGKYHICTENVQGFPPLSLFLKWYTITTGYIALTLCEAL